MSNNSQKDRYIKTKKEINNSIKREKGSSLSNSKKIIIISFLIFLTIIVIIGLVFAIVL